MSDAVRETIERGLSPLRIFPKMIAWFIVIIVLFLVLTTIFYGIAFAVNSYTSGAAQTFVTYFEVQLPKIPLIGNYYQWLFATIGSYIIDPTQAISNDPEIETIEDDREKDLGITIEDFRPRSDFLSGEFMDLTATINTYTLRDSAVVSLRCATEDVEGIVDTPQIILKKYDSQSTNVACEFPEGSIITEKKSGGRKVVFGTKYDFNTEAFVDIWAMDEQKKVDYVNQYRRNPLNDVIDKKYIDDKEKGSMKTVFTPGPMEIGIGGDSQPFTDEGPGNRDFYSMFIKMDKNKDWEGNFVEIENLRIKLTENFELINDGSKRFSKFTKIENDGKFNVYELDQNELDERANNICEDLGLVDLATLGIFRDDGDIKKCVDRLSKGFPRIDFGLKVVKLDSEELIKYPGVIVEVEYKFETQEYAFMNINNPEA
ncbi:hypothetical protein CL617_00155 [archaeon]|nr:hypothetical protein [archaeon]